MAYQDDLERSINNSNGTTVAALFKNRHDVGNAVDELNAAHFANDDIGVIWHDRDRVNGDGINDSDRPNLTPSTTDRVAEGALAGGVLGGAAGLLAGMASLLIPGVGPFLAGGLLATVLTGAVAGGLLGALINAGIPENEARYYDEAVRGGQILVTVRAGSRAMEATMILERNGGQTGIPQERVVDTPPITPAAV